MEEKEVVCTYMVFLGFVFSRFCVVVVSMGGGGGASLFEGFLGLCGKPGSTKTSENAEDVVRVSVHNGTTLGEVGLEGEIQGGILGLGKVEGSAGLLKQGGTETKSVRVDVLAGNVEALVVGGRETEPASLTLTNGNLSGEVDSRPENGVTALDT